MTQASGTLIATASRMSVSKPAAFLLTLALILTALSSPAWSQAVAVAEVSGTVTDSSGGALPTAQVIMTETNKQQVRTALTDSSGHYVLTAMCSPRCRSVLTSSR